MYQANNVISIGSPPWSRESIINSLEEFALVYAHRPIKENIGGMRAPHMFAVWFMVKQLVPDLIVESGVWKGQSTWILEQACPNAKIVSIDLNLSQRKYISEKAIYSDRDFSSQEWPDVTERSLVFFDDHQNAYNRLIQCHWFGFKHIIFEDNYPVTQGDCYSLKKAFSNAGFRHAASKQSLTGNGFFSKSIRKVLGKMGIHAENVNSFASGRSVSANSFDAGMLKKHLEIYYEFPPPFKVESTRWGDDWADPDYPTPEPLLTTPKTIIQDLLLKEAKYYTWICYAKLK